MKDIIQEDIKSFIIEEVEHLSNHESNYNNADVTSGQKCHSDEEIEEMIRETMHFLGSTLLQDKEITEDKTK